MTDLLHPPAIRVLVPKGRAPGGSTPTAIDESVPEPRTLSDATAQRWLTLRLFTSMLDDAEAHRKALWNRLGAAQRQDIAAAIDPEFAEIAFVPAKTHEDDLRKHVVKAFRKAAPEIAAWAHDTHGLGEPSVARLLGHIGHPIIATPAHWEGEGADRVLVRDEPFVRTIAQLWAYCGCAPGREKRKGMTADEAFLLGNPRAKVAIHLIAASAVRTKSRAYFEHYLDFKRHYEETRPETTKGHRDNMARRRLKKLILKDLYAVAAKELS